MFKGIVFDIGQTLVEYNRPLNWSKLYRPALEYVAEECKMEFSNEQYDMALKILTKYNTRINPRDYEVTSDEIFGEILHALDRPLNEIDKIKFHFYSYFRQDVSVFGEVEETLKELADKGVLLGTLSDVAYGMDNVYALADIAPIIKYIDYPMTSNDVGYRKPSPEGLKLLAQKMNIEVREMAFVGDEEKDIACAFDAGVYSILINRSGNSKKYGQNREIVSLDELLKLYD